MKKYQLRVKHPLFSDAYIVLQAWTEDEAIDQVREILCEVAGFEDCGGVLWDRTRKVYAW